MPAVPGRKVAVPAGPDARRSGWPRRQPSCSLGLSRRLPPAWVGGLLTELGQWAGEGRGSVRRYRSGFRTESMLDGRKFSRTFSTAREARDWLAQLRVAHGRGLLPEPSTVLNSTGPSARRWGGGCWGGTRPTGQPRPRYRPPEMRALTPEEAARFLDAARAGNYYVFFAAVHTGMRLRELLGLRWEDVDFGAGVLRVRRTLQWVRGRGPAIPPPETPASRRKVPMAPGLAAALPERAPAGPGRGPQPVRPGRRSSATWSSPGERAGPWTRRRFGGRSRPPCGPPACRRSGPTTCGTPRPACSWPAGST